MESLRGTGDLGAWADTVLMMDRNGESAESPSQVIVAKQRDVPECDPFLLTLEFTKDSARFIYHEGDARSLRVQKLMEDVMELLRKLGASGSGLLKTDLETELKGGHEIKRDAIEQLHALKRISIKLLLRPAKDGKTRKQKVVFLVETTSAGKESRVAVSLNPHLRRPLGGGGCGVVRPNTTTSRPVVRKFGFKAIRPLIGRLRGVGRRGFLGEGWCLACWTFPWLWFQGEFPRAMSARF